MTALRHLEHRLKAWRSFRDIAHAARTLAAAQSLRWSGKVDQAARHLALCEHLRRSAAAGDDAGVRPRARAVIAIGTDLGLCGRLNRTVAEALLERVRADAPALALVVGARLAAELPDDPKLGEALPTPTTFAAVEGLASRLTRLLDGLAPAHALELTLVLAGRALASGAPVIATWTATPTADPQLAAHLAELRSRTRSPLVRLTPPEIAAEAADRLLVHARLVHALCAAASAEAAARLQTMSRAFEASERRIGEQERHLRKLQQEATTQEMLEVLGGRRSALASSRTAWRRPDRRRS
ncbi:MAG: F0F1 ATP synthase subunit gamma [Nannocystaceae bacterium]